MQATRFSERNPAPTIRELLAYLQDTHEKRHVFRGQTKHYASLVPSGYRIACERRDLNKIMVPLDSRFDKIALSERETVRLKELNRLIQSYGLGLGNVLAQQYGITSECLDITTDPLVAAFFATRKFPEYAHWRGSTDNPVGVIYRFTAIDFVSDLNGLDMTLQFVGKEVDGNPVWFMKHLKRSQLSPEELEGILTAREHVTEGLYTHPGVVTYELLRSSIHQHYEEKNAELLAKQTSGDKPILLTAHKHLDDTRMIRQRGGFLIPSCTWECTVPKYVEIEHEPVLKNRFFKPSYAIGERLVAVENLCQYPRLEAFFFLHSAEEISELSREYLWPEIGRDRFFHLLSVVVSVNNSEYLAKHGCEADDKEHGILDRGYY